MLFQYYTGCNFWITWSLLELLKVPLNLRALIYRASNYTTNTIKLYFHKITHKIILYELRFIIFTGVYNNTKLVYFKFVNILYPYIYMYIKSEGWNRDDHAVLTHTYIILTDYRQNNYVAYAYCSVIRYRVVLVIELIILLLYIYKKHTHTTHKAHTL